jgi:thioredoxin 1
MRRSHHRRDDEFSFPAQQRPVPNDRLMPRMEILMDNLIEFTDESFSAEASEGLVLVDFWAPWCMPCRQVGPIIEDLADEYAGKVKVGKLNVDDHQRVAQTFRVMSIPTVILFKDGELVEQLVGVKSKSDYVARIAKHTASAN